MLVVVLLGGQDTDTGILLSSDTVNTVVIAVVVSPEIITY